MKKILWIISLSIILIAAVCVVAYHLQGFDNNKIIEAGDCCPHATIYLQPYDNFTQKEAGKLKADLDKRLERIIDCAITVVVLPNKQLSDFFLGETGKKYRIDKIIESIKDSADAHNIYIGITHRDICKEYKNGVKDWGVLGSSIPDYHACVVSDHRMKHKRRDMWKTVTHEFIHTFYDYPHCPKDSAQCLMKDAKGHANLGIQKDLCDYCKSMIR